MGGGGGGLKRTRQHKPSRRGGGGSGGNPTRNILKVNRLKWAENNSKIKSLIDKMTQCILWPTHS